MKYLGMFFWPGTCRSCVAEEDAAKRTGDDQPYGVDPQEEQQKRRRYGDCDARGIDQCRTG